MGHSAACFASGHAHGAATSTGARSKRLQTLLVQTELARMRRWRFCKIPMPSLSRSYGGSNNMITASILISVFLICAIGSTLVCCAILLKGPVAMAPQKPCVGSFGNPHTVSSGFGEPEIPYGDWCKCAHCGLVDLNTSTFRFTAEFQGGYLRCEKCFMVINDPNL